MAIEKERLSADLKAKVGENDYSDETWGTIVDKAMGLVPEDDKKYDDFVNAQADFLKSLNGQNKHTIAETIKAQMKLKDDEWNKNHQPTEDKNNPPKDDDKDHKSDEGKDSALEALEKEVAEMKKEREEESARGKISEKQKEVLKTLKEQGCDNDEVLEFVTLKLNINKDSDVSDLEKEGKKIYDEKYKKLYSRTYIPSSGGSSLEHEKERSKEVQKILEKNKARLKNVKY